MGARLCLSRFASGAETIDYRESIGNRLILEEEDDQLDPREEEYEWLSQSQDVRNAFLTKEYRRDGITLVGSYGPSADRTEDFWHEIIERRIPSVFMLCDFFRNGSRVCAQYIPKSNERTRRCGVYTVERTGQTVSLNANLNRQQLLVYRTDDVSGYKHRVMHFQQTGRLIDLQVTKRNYALVAQMASHQPNPQVFFHKEWAPQTEFLRHTLQ